MVDDVMSLAVNPVGMPNQIALVDIRLKQYTSELFTIEECSAREHPVCLQQSDNTEFL